ncbi:MAG: hypothetical protein FJW37_14780, partial [Acidobacteria bacterium]|nr:hypothetical protein [Acidobacteriota bacterium]
MRPVAIAALLSSALWGASGGRLTPEAIVGMRTAQSVAMRPDGGSIAYVVSEPVKNSRDPANTEIWTVSADGESGKRLTENPGGDFGPQWSPDGSRLAFLSNRPGDSGSQIYVYEARSGKVRKLTNQDSGILSFGWSPDGGRIAFTAPAPLPPEVKAALEAGDDEIVFRLSDHDRRAAPNRLWLMDTAGGSPRLLPTGARDVHVISLAWSPDGSKLLLVVADENNMDGEWIRSRLVTVSSEGGEPAAYCSIPGKFVKPKWRPDGAAISFLGASEARDPSAGILFLCAGEGSSPVMLTGSLEATLAGYSWLPNGKAVLLSVIEKNSRYLARLDVESRK